MNYYSRNSPIKHKKKYTPPGFLLLAQSEQSHALTSRSVSRKSYDNHSWSGQQNSSFNHSAIEQSISQQTQILIIDDESEDDHKNQSNSILIVDEDDQQQIIQYVDKDQTSKLSIIEDQGENQSSPRQSIPSDNQFLPQNLKKEQIYEEQLSHKKYNKIQNGCDKIKNIDIQQNQTNQQQYQIPRNYSFGNNDLLSFGDTSSQSSSRGAINPVIRKLFGPEIISQIQNTPKMYKEIKESQKKSKYKKKNVQVAQRGEQDWQKFLNIFMKKRSSMKKREQISEKQQSQTGQQYSQSLVNKKQQLQSQQSGYFKIIDRQQQQLQYINYNRQKNQFQRPENNHSSINTYNNSLKMLTQIFQCLPQSHLNIYLKIHNQLIKKSRQFQIIEKKQIQTMQMMKMLLKMHKNNIYVDDYVLAQFPSELDERLAINREIIFSLIRKLANNNKNI